MMSDRLFVYGTLMRGYDHPMARLLSSNAEFLGAASIPGRLYLVRHYPGLVPSDDPADRVHGEVFRLHRPDEVLAQLDDYEGCGPRDQRAEYRREIACVTLEGGTELDAFVYYFNWDVARLPHIATGRFQPEAFSG
ncbi:gamma-glutamylcyclotransferase family protein [Rhodopseudomonas palustris]|uniref:Gamma-glutamylcyclotransferase n=1 Tax=Rhodopseudomonas palustris (strain ATCC BAA-98 / CGA009) TaxID=258594 RepID=Q6NAA0_RHOPA|nr:gamma-glutamylcyclotransferase family protein [Rhodopseudomonas palustris]OPF91450.1 gamma-glutamylcyclotransferase [Rhodopseudomonas palustris]PPQ40934.1 gamma-glutamylcyclotransferase [Rhodopseudomonas palustris]RJF60391.1 gamma-glutamylcyclotransferase [Rhodopseudomonas palustris]WAB78959.1 gamma-glutamylcyclotransferase [Rhodopseudomonas palustris]WCL91420.1 gamma-glutamylcyclotransferase [Rhodopseudomonas palustris CGA009]